MYFKLPHFIFFYILNKIYKKSDYNVNLFLNKSIRIFALLSNTFILLQLYKPLNIFVVLVGIEVWKEEDPIALSTDAEKTLINFLYYRKARLIPKYPNDIAQLLTLVSIIY